MCNYFLKVFNSKFTRIAGLRLYKHFYITHTLRTTHMKQSKTKKFNSNRLKVCSVRFYRCKFFAFNHSLKKF